jgi:glycosidase
MVPGHSSPGGIVPNDTKGFLKINLSGMIKIVTHQQFALCLSIFQPSSVNESFMSQYEFHVSRKSRQKYQFDESLFGLQGSVLLADFAAARRFAGQMSKGRLQPVPAGEINAMGLIDEILHLLLRQYEMQHPSLMERALARVGESDAALLRFIEDFPPLAVYRGDLVPQRYLDMETAGTPHRQSTLEELFLLHLANDNPAFAPYRELFDDSELRAQTDYPRLISGLQSFLDAQPGLGSGGESLYAMLTAPARIAPHSLIEQLQFLLNRWGALLGEGFVMKLLRGLDFTREESIRGNFAGGFAGDAPVLTFTGHDYTEYERFSPDKDWMPRCVLIARNAYVWLEQLSKKYQRWIRTLSDIPDEELDTLAHRGFTGLWLIGLWERSQASRKMKQMMGDPDAVASAYSLMNYDIAADLGGWDALQNLRARAWQRGIRLSADMVPNHMGIDSQWVLEHPDWFLALPYSPYPNYSYNGADLSSDGRVGIQIEDHYYDRTDAAVVFKRFDRWTGDTRYIYHGNDGTSMPWNDTAQLDYSKAEVREAVIQTILHVARNFPIIRFDAAMTLAKKHIQRLWFPEPGAGGAVPSRSEHGMARAQFDAAVPEEFWRQVVDRVAAEVPDTLLLAEAFWMMEGYFVRTLGMHRVYNSAFMHMLRDEDNANYRSVMKNVLEFDPQVLKRFVNFMNNPDEKTAIEQFGDGDKYFGVCTLLATLPGLPMFGHGQVEGFHEKYGMEFRRPKWDEAPNEGLVRGHDWRIFPLLHQRRIFAEVENFLLYDFYTQDGKVNEDVFAFSNRLGEERGLVVYHNKYAQTRGWVKTSAAFMDKASGQLVRRTLAEGLGLTAGPSDYVAFHDYVTHLEYIRSCRELAEKGLYVELGGYQCHAFLDVRFVSGDRWAQVCAALNGAGLSSVQAMFDEMFVVKEEVSSEKAKIKGKPAAKKSRKKPAAGTKGKSPSTKVPKSSK